MCRVKFPFMRYCCSEDLRDTVTRLLSANEVLTGEALIQQLVDEHASSIFLR
jgi:hypothetical protein